MTSIQGFRLGASAPTVKGSRQDKEAAAASVNKSLLSIDYASQSFILMEQPGAHIPLENLETLDYLQEGDVGFKKPKVRSRYCPLMCQFLIRYFRQRRNVHLGALLGPKTLP